MLGEGRRVGRGTHKVLLTASWHFMNTDAPWASLEPPIPLWQLLAGGWWLVILRHVLSYVVT